jgi:hypothetical protein
MTIVRDAPGTDSFAQTPARRLREGVGSETIIKSFGTASVETPYDLPANTRPAQGFFSRFGSYVLPLAVAAAFASPMPMGEIRRRILVGPHTTRYDFGDYLWASDGWTYTTEPADYEHVMLLKDLLSLSMAEGLVLDPTE